MRNNTIAHKGVLLRLWRYLGKNAATLCAAVLMSMTGTALTLYGPRLSGAAINAIAAGPGQVDMQVVYRCILWMAIVYIGAAVMNYCLNAVMIRLSRSVARQLRHDIFACLSTLPISYFDTHAAGDIINIATYDVDTVCQSIAADVLQLLQGSITVTVSLVMMLRIKPVLVLVFAVTIPMTILFTKYLVRRVRKLFRARSRTLGELSGFVEEMLSGIRTIHAYGRDQEVEQAFRSKNERTAEAGIAAESKGTLAGPSVNFFNNLSLTGICISGALLFLRGEILLGDLSTFVQYSRKFSGPINETANIISELQSAVAALERIFELLDTQPEPQDTPEQETLREVQGDVRFSNVSFSYVPEAPLLEKFDLHAEPGSMTAIVGPTGAGKTTIVNLLMRFYDVTAGGIQIDGRDIRSVTRQSLREAFSMVLQETWLFTGTIYENLAYGNKQTSKQAVMQAARAAQVHDYIMSLPDGYETVLTDGGSSLSKGQKQLLTIARAMLHPAQILILDEATSNVDTQTEQQIQQAMRTLMQGKTCFVIAHRLSTIQAADQILVLQNGHIVEQGKHEALMRAGGAYRRLYDAQFQRA